MYDVYIENADIKRLIHSDAITNIRQGLKIINGTGVEGINTINTFSFDILTNNPCFNELFPYSTKIYVFNIKKNKYVFKGRIIKSKLSMETDGSYSKHVECEDKMGYLRDTLMDYLPEQYWNVNKTSYNADGTIKKRGVIEYVLNLHNKKQPVEKHIFIGEILIEDTEKTLFFGMQQHKNAFDSLKEKLVEHLGGELKIREGEDGKLYLDYMPEIGEIKSTTIKSKKNLQKLDKETDPTAYITRLYPLGAKIKKQIKENDGTISEVETDERYTCAEANNGLPYIDDKDGIELYGIIEGYQYFDHVVKPATLLNHGKVYMATNNKVKQKYVVSSLDLSTIGLDIDTFETGNYYPIIDEVSNINDVLRIIKKTYSINEPETSQLEFGDKYATSTELQLKRENDLKNQFHEEIVTIENNANYNVIKTQNYLTSLINQFSDRIEQIIAEKTVSINDFNKYITEISTKFTQTSDNFSFLFEELQKEIQNINGTVTTNQNQIIKYIRFEDGNIILGMVGNEILLKQSHDRISFLQNNIEVAYFSNNKLYVSDAEFINGITVLTFEFTKEANGSYTFG